MPVDDNDGDDDDDDDDDDGDDSDGDRMAPADVAGDDEVDDEDGDFDERPYEYEHVDPAWCREFSSQKLPMPPFCNVIQPKLRAVIHSLFCQHPPKGKDPDKFNGLLVRFLVMSAVKKNGDWRHSASVTQTIAAITFCGRLTMYSMMLEAIRLQPDANFHE